MSAHGMKPQFKDDAGYRHWRAEWRIIYAMLATQIRRDKTTLKEMQRKGDATTPVFQKKLMHKRIMAWKTMTLLEEAKLRRQQIAKMKQSLADQRALFPLVEADCRHLDFHFNKASIQWPFLPMWVVKTRGRTFYVDHVEANVPWTTKETPDHASTKGAIRFRNCNLSIAADGTATIA